MSRAVRWALIALAIGVWLLSPMLFPGRETVLVVMALYAPIVVGIALLAGYTGQVSLGQAAFFGIGAYGTGVLTVHAELSPWLAMPAAAAAAGVVAVVVGAPIFLLRGQYLVLATLGLNVIFVVVVGQLDLTGGASGLTGIPPLSIGGTTFLGPEFFFYAGSALALASMILSSWLIRSRIGRALQAIEGSETAAATLGISRRRHTTQVFAWSAVLAGASGGLYAEWLQFISPSTFSLDVSIELLIMAVIGGIASVPGALVGVVLVLSLREALRELAPGIAGAAGSGTASAEYELILFGLLLTAVVIFMPEGVWPRLVSMSRPRSRGAGQLASAHDVQEPSPAVAEPAPVTESPDRNMAPLLAVEGLSRRFGGVKALDDVSFSVGRGEIFAIIGPNGAGKTTVLNLLSGVVKPNAGSIEFEGRDVTKLAAHRIAELGMARSFQTPRLFELLSVIDNVKVGLHRHVRVGFLRSVLGLGRREETAAAAAARDALDLVGGRSAEAERPGRLPFGMLRVVELARSLASRPRVLLLDEPASGLSAEEREQLKSLIRRIRDQGVTVVLVEHDVPLVMELADRVMVLHHGRHLAEGAPSDISADQGVVSAYLGESTGTVSERRRQVTDDGESPLLRITGLSAGYGAVEVLHDVDVEVRSGEIVAVLGANGAGKTTLLRAVMGIVSSHGGREFEGASIAGLAPERVTRHGLALVPEGRELFRGLTVHDHLLLGSFGRRDRSEGTGLDADLAEVYDLFPALEERRSQPANTLSGGQQQMVAIARALMSRPKLLLLDEPLLGLAPLVVRDILDSIAALADRGHGVVLVEQNAAGVLPIVDRAYVLRQGRVAVTGAATDLMTDPSVRAAFLGEGDPLATEAAQSNGPRYAGERTSNEERGVHP